MTVSKSAVGVALALAGVLFLLDALAIVDLWAAGGGWWPTLLIIVGLALLLRRSSSGPARARSGLALLSSRTLECPDQPFYGGRLVALLGHIEYDLRPAVIDEGGASLRVWSVLGHVAVIVPPGWAVEVGPRRLVADVVIELLPPADDVPALSIRGVAVLSDVHVRTGSVVA